MSQGPSEEGVLDGLRAGQSVRGGSGVAERFAALYPDLRRLARARLRREGTMTLLDTTALVQESFLQFIRRGALAEVERPAFMAYAAQVMRSIVVDYARSRRSQRRGGDVEHVTLDTGVAESLPGHEDQILRVDEAIEVLAKVEPRLARVVELHYFGGLSEVEIASALEISDRTVRRDLQKALLLLRVALT